MPFDSTPASFAGSRFAMNTTLRPTSVSGGWDLARPATIWRTPAPSSTSRRSSFLDFGTASAAATRPTRNSICVN